MSLGALGDYLAATLTSTIPSRLTAGETAVWTLANDDYPASAGWVLTLALRPSSGSASSIVGVASGDAWAVTLDQATSEALATGRCHWQAWVTKDTTQQLAGSGTFEVAPSLLSGAAADPRSFDERVLDALNAVIEGRASEDFLEMEVGGRKLKLMSLKELLESQSIFKARVRAAGGGSLFTFHRVVFNA